MRASSGREGVGLAVGLATAVLLLAPAGALAAGSAVPAVAHLQSCPTVGHCVVVATRPHLGWPSASAWGSLGTVFASPVGSGNFTWSGQTPDSFAAANWSHATNWVGNVAPATVVGTLTFPILTSAACTSGPPADVCYESNNNLNGLSADAISLDDGASYVFSGNAITLGGGGLTASTASTTLASPPQFQLPIILGAGQTWTITGNDEAAQVSLAANISGAPNALTINLNHQTFLSVGSSDVEVGPVTITSATTTGLNGSVTFISGGKLNATDGSSVTLTGTGTGIVAAANSTIGAFNANGGTTQVGDGDFGGAILSVNGGATLRAPHTLQMNIVHAGTTAGIDYSRLNASGSVSLGGALALVGSSGGGGCPRLHVDDVDTLVTTSGALNGTFSGVPDGTIVAVGCAGAVEPTVRINYTAHAVTATVFTVPGAPTVNSVTPEAGPTGGGNTIVIKGRGYVAGATVHFGATASPSVTFVSSSTLKAVVPAAASPGVVDVTVTINGATSATSKADLYAYGAPTITSFTPTSGITGSKVTINGTDFVPAANVKFGELSAKPIFMSPTRLKAIVPNGAVPGAILVTTRAGAGTSSTNFMPTLSITGLNPESGPIGTLMRINGAGFTNTSTVKFNGTAASSVTFVSANELQAIVPAGASTGPITVTNTAKPIGTVHSAGDFTVT